MSYKEVLDLCFPELPKDTYNIVERIRTYYPCEIFSVNDDAFLLLVKISDGFSGVSWVVVRPNQQNHGYGSLLLRKVHLRHHGVFIAKTKGSEQFYIKNGYVPVSNDGERTVLVFVNDKDKINF